MGDYVAAATVKEWLGIPTATLTEDAAIAAAISAAEDRIDKFCGRTFVVPSGTSVRSCRPWSSTTVIVPAEIAQTTSLAVKTDTADDGVFDTTLTITDDFYLGPNDLAPWTELTRVAGYWPNPSSGRASVEVTAYFGYAMTVPDSVVQAATMLAARLYQRRSSPLGFQTGVSNEFGAVRISRLDPDISGLLTGYRRLAMA